MRVIAGRFRGRQLASFDAGHIRPTTDRVKESIFNKLQGHFDEARVLDLFAGTGNLSIEALSRGAREVECVEMSKKSIAIIQKNIATLGIEKREIRVVCDDVLKYLRKSSGPAFDVILADPPFTEKIAHDVMFALVESQVIGPQTLIMIESSSHEKMDDEYSGRAGRLKRFDSRDYGDKVVSYFEREDLSGQKAEDTTEGRLPG